jgi:hypothetical protein
MKGKLILRGDDINMYTWCIEFSPEVELFSYEEFETEEEARAEALGWAKRLNIQLWEDER